MTPKQKAKKIFDKHYHEQLDKELYPREVALGLALDEATTDILNYNCLCQWVMDFKLSVKQEIKKL